MRVKYKNKPNIGKENKIDRIVATTSYFIMELPSK